MPWQQVSIVQLRYEFVRLYEQGGNLSQLCRRFGISRTTGYKWLGRYGQGEALVDRSRRPLTSPKRSDAAIETAVLDLRKAHPAWGARKLRRRLQDLGQTVPAPSTVHAILVRNGCVSEAASAAATSWQRFEHAASNDLWQMDFKGHFALRAGRCHPLTVLDDHSRYNLCLAACGDESRRTVRTHLITTFRRYGLPRRMTMDNGAPWGDTGAVYTQLDVWLMKQGITISHSRPYHPQTQGKDERFHRTLNIEILQGRLLDHLEAAQARFNWWREVYNSERPHEALALATPVTRYTPSPIEYREHVPAPEYGNPAHVRHVQPGGWIRWQHHPYRVGKAFIGEAVEVRPTRDEHHLEVCWYTHRIARIDLTLHTSTHGRNLP